MKIGLISDTHSFLDPAILTLFEDRDEIWHGGDFGSQEVVGQLKSFKPLRGVSGNIDNPQIMHQFPVDLHWTVGNFKVYMTHIAGYPGKYTSRVKKQFLSTPVDLFICGHSHILKILKDQSYGHLHINPGACGHEGFHSIRTAVRFEIVEDKLKNLEIIELGLRGRLNS